MSTRPLPGHPPSAAGRAPRVEYLGFQNLEEHREFRYRVHVAEAPAELRVRIPLAAFGDGRVRLQDGPDVCYQKLLRAAGTGENVIPDLITIDDADLAGYREAHTPATRHRSFTPATTQKAAAPRNPPRTPFQPRPVPPPPAALPPPAFGVGQRVRHAVFGAGVTAASSREHTVVCFDEGSKKTFVTSILELDVLSAPHTWETTRRGVNQPVAQPVGGASGSLAADE